MAARPLSLPPVHSFLDGASGLCATGACTPADVKSWLAAPANAAWRTFLVTDTTGRVQYCRFAAEYLIELESKDSVYAMMDGARQAIKPGIVAGGFEGFAYSPSECSAHLIYFIHLALALPAAVSAGFAARAAWMYSFIYFSRHTNMSITPR